MKRFLLRPKAINYFPFLNHSTEVKNDSFSSLYVTGSQAQQTHNVVRPTYDVQYLEDLSSNLKFVRTIMARRGMPIDNIQWDHLEGKLHEFSLSLAEINVFKRKREKLKKKMKRLNQTSNASYEQLNEAYIETKKKFNQLEDEVIPFVLKVPSTIREDVKDQPEVIDQCSGRVVPKVSNQPALSYLRLGYINNTFQPSLNGSNAKYLIGEGAQLYHALCYYLQDIFHASKYKLVSGIDIVKSAIVEAVNSKQFSNNPSLIRLPNNDIANHNVYDQRLHLVGESSLESLCALLLKKPMSPFQYFQLGSVYEGSPIEQKYCLNASIISQFNESDHQMEQLYQLMWKILSNDLHLRCQSIRTSASSLQSNEYARYELLTMLPSSMEWIPVGRIVHHHHYVTQRMGVPDYKSYHLITSQLDLLTLIKSIFEHYHDPSNADLIRPDSLIKYYFN